MTGCTEKPVPCPVHGDNMTPFGRDAGDLYRCCDNYAKSDINPRHLWSIHDSTRWYNDPEGWAAHEASCELCAPEKDL